MNSAPPPDPTDAPLSRISTLWSLVAQAHGGFGAAATAAQHALLLRYAAAVYRYLLVAVRDSTAADDLSQEFAARWLSGEFKNADPARGRFRGYLTTALRHLVADHFRRRRPVGVDWQANSHFHPPAPPADDDLDAAFVREWRQELLNAAWRELEREGDGQFYAVLRWRAAHPNTPAAVMADELAARTGKAVTAAGVRQTLRRARARFAELLDGEVARSLGGAGGEAVERELEALGLRGYCRPGGG